MAFHPSAWHYIRIMAGQPSKMIFITIESWLIIHDQGSDFFYDF